MSEMRIISIEWKPKMRKSCAQAGEQATETEESAKQLGRCQDARAKQKRSLHNRRRRNGRR